MSVFLFPGQGSQFIGMGKKLFFEYKDYTKIADEILGYSVEELCLTGLDNKLDLTEYTQPAIFTVNHMYYLDKIKSGIIPNYVAGHSLGEYNALLASNVIDFETGLRLVSKRGSLMGTIKDGKMAAVVGLNHIEIIDVINENNLNSIDIANFNTPSQFVISGPTKDLEKCEDLFLKKGAKRYIILNVAGAFHSRYMEDIMLDFGKYLEKIEFSIPKIKVISNVTARPYSFENIKENIIKQISSSVKWTETIQYLMGKGESEFINIGPSIVIDTMVKAILREAKPIIVNDEVFIDEIGKNDENESSNISDRNNENSENKVIGKGDKFSKDITFSAEKLGSSQFKREYNLKYAYITGAMYRGIASKELVVKVSKAGMLGVFGSGGLQIKEIEESIKYIKAELNNGENYAMNLINNPDRKQIEVDTVDLYLKYGVNIVEAAAYIDVSKELVKYRAKGLKKLANNEIKINNRIIAKISRPEVAENFLRPARKNIIKELLEQNEINLEEADLLEKVPMCDDITVEADSGGHTDHGVAYSLMPAITNLRDNISKEYNYKSTIRVGAAGGIGTPQAAAAAFILGADYIVTGSINQCTKEARNSDLVKDMLQELDVQDTTDSPAGDAFEVGSKIQVVKKGLFFPQRANKLHLVYTQNKSLDDIDETIKNQIEKRYFKKSFEEIYIEILKKYPHEKINCEKSGKYKMALVFKWYFKYSTQIAIMGDEENKVDFQIHCGPCLGAFNRWVKGTKYENWRNRNVDEIGVYLLDCTAKYLEKRFNELLGGAFFE